MNKKFVVSSINIIYKKPYAPGLRGQDGYAMQQLSIYIVSILFYNCSKAISYHMHITIGRA